MAIELETLEVLLEVNTARLQESLDKVMPNLENFFKRLEGTSNQSMNRTEANMDITKGANRFADQLERMNKTLESNFKKMQQTSQKSSESVGDSVASGIRRARPKMSKEIDAMVKEMNAKMGQASAAQEKIAYLRSQRQSASNNFTVIAFFRC